MDVGLVAGTHALQKPPEEDEKAVILLDTNAVIWLHDRHPRAAALERDGRPLYVSPATLLELQVLTAILLGGVAFAGRLSLRRGATPQQLLGDDRWAQDDPAAAAWFEAALDIGWTRDVFDRLLVAHARFRRWRLATADALILEHLAAHEILEL